MAATALLALTAPAAASAAGGLATHRAPLPARMFSNALSVKTRTPTKRVNVATRATAWPDVASWEKPPGLRMLPDRTDGASRPPVSAPPRAPFSSAAFQPFLHTAIHIHFLARSCTLFVPYRPSAVRVRYPCVTRGRATRVLR